MIGTLNTQDKRVTIIGAGVSGLLIGYALKKKGYQVTIHEKSNRTGGLIQTKQTPYGLVETAAHSILVNNTVKKFLGELGVELTPVNKKSKARFIYRNGKMRKIPLSIFELFSTLFHFFSKPHFPATTSLDQLTLEEWGNAYLGKAATRFLLAPFTSGIFACHPRELNAQLCFPKLVPHSANISLFQHFRSLKKEQKKEHAQMMVLKYGTEDLILKLTHALRDEIKLNSTISNLDDIEGNLILSTPHEQVSYSPLITATVFYSNQAFINKPPLGVGVLIPRGENFRLLGCLFNSSAFAGRSTNSECTSLTVMYGGTEDPNALSLTEIDLTNLIKKELTQLLGAQLPPLSIETTRWQRAVPIYSFALKILQKNWAENFCSKRGKIIFSNFSGQVSIRGMIETVCKL